MAMLGGINKNEIAKGREAIDRELNSGNSSFLQQVTEGFSGSFRKYVRGIAQAAEIPIE